MDVQQTRKKKKKRLESRGVSQANWRNISFTNNTDMPYRRTYAYGKKRPAYKKRARKASTAYGTLALNALKGYALAKLKQKLGLNTEEKHADTNSTTTATGTLASRIASPTIPQGDSDSTRTGSQIRITRVDTRIVITPATAGTPTACRIIQIRHLQPTAPGLGNILEDTTRITSPLNEQIHNYGIQVLKDITVPVNNVTGGGSTIVEWTHRGLSDHMVWAETDTTGLPSGTIKGLIATYWMLDANFSVAPVFEGTSRYWYVDN